MHQQINYEEDRYYNVKCPCCNQYMNVSGETMKVGNYIRCFRCGCISRVSTWEEHTRENR